MEGAPITGARIIKGNKEIPTPFQTLMILETDFCSVIKRLWKYLPGELVAYYLLQSKETLKVKHW